ncbi:hypothetical protein BOTCAL_0287g00050 [Botryotinia calthae]|uniref:Uncharacterized protein n=1 Tax=Botryotinia calthae TaxID=38488 RepID=A0A4Y8CUY5_9HELO|nr:hypothetical protein BOTCAL_0287g00050 [Botryotinia calthae]
MEGESTEKKAEDMKDKDIKGARKERTGKKKAKRAINSSPQSLPPRTIPKPDDGDVYKICVMFLPQMQRIVEIEMVPCDGIVQQTLRGFLCGHGIVPVLRELASKDDSEPGVRAHPKGTGSTKLTSALVELFNENALLGEGMDFCHSLRDPEKEKAMRIKFILGSGSVPVQLPLKERDVFFMESHETDDRPYLMQDNFPDHIRIPEDVLLKACPFIRSAFGAKDIGKFADPDDTCLYDPAYTSNRKRCIRQTKLVYIADLIASSFGRTAQHYHSLSDLKQIDSWPKEKLWKHTKSWVIFLRKNDFSERISSNHELDELCTLAAFFGAKNNATTALRNMYQAQKERLIREKTHPRPALLPQVEPERKKLSPDRGFQQSDCVTNGPWNDMVGTTGWRSRDD